MVLTTDMPSTAFFTLSVSMAAAVVAAAMDTDKVKKAVEGMSVVKTILVKNKLVNLIVKPDK